MPKLSVDLSEFEAHKISKGPTCSVGKAISKLTEARQANLAAAFASDDILTTQIRAVLADWGHAISPNCIGRHRRGECACG